MLTSIKALLHLLLAPLLYAGIWVAFLAAAFKRAEWGLYLLVILIPLPVVWYQLHQLPFGKDTMDILILGTSLGILLNKGGFERAPHGGLIGTFMLVSFLSVWNATLQFNLPLPFTTANPLIVDWKNYAEMIFLYFIAYNVVRNEDQQKTLIVIMATVILLIALREFRNFTESASFSYDKRASGPFWIVGLGANHFGAFVVHYGGLLLGLFLIDTHKHRKRLYLAAVLLCLHPLFFSYSRGAYLAALVLVMVYGILKKRSLLVLLAVLIFTWQVVLPATVVERITMTETADGLEESAAVRVILWQHAMQLFQDNPIFGIGFNSFGFTVPPGSLTDTHNFYMKTASEQGLIGLTMLALILFCALLSGWRLYRSGQSTFHQGLGLGFVGCTLAVAATNVFGDRWSYFTLGAYFWIFWGLVDRAYRLAQEQKTAAASEVTPSPTPAPG